MRFITYSTFPGSMNYLLLCYVILKVHLRYCSLKLDKGLFSLSKKDGLDKWSWHLDVRISQKFCQKRCNFLWKWSQKIKLLEWCSFKLFCSTSSHHFNFVWMYVFNAFSHYNKKNRKTDTNTNLNFVAKKSRFIFTSTSARVK